MGMDLYFQAFDAQNQPLGERQNLRCREIYHTFNRWCEQLGWGTPESGERVNMDAAQWGVVAPKIAHDIAQVDQAICGSNEEQAQALGAEWLERIWPAGAHRVEYWFTV